MSIRQFEAALLGLLDRGSGGSLSEGNDGGSTRLPDPSDQINPGDGSRNDTARALNAAFLITLAGPGHPLFWEADVLFEKIIRTEEGSRLGRYYQRGRSAIWREIEPLGADEPPFDEILSALVFTLGNPAENPSRQGAAVSKIPVTTALLRTALDAATLFAEGRRDEATHLLERAAGKAC